MQVCNGFRVRQIALSGPRIFAYLRVFAGMVLPTFITMQMAVGPECRGSASMRKLGCRSRSARASSNKCPEVLTPSKLKPKHSVYSSRCSEGRAACYEDLRFGMVRESRNLSGPTVVHDSD